MGYNRPYELMDILNALAFLIGVANYEETIDQNQLQEILNNVVRDIHEHLKEQDRKIEHVINLLEKEE